eukprot:CAMPEP_0201593378 /NCGR_PEP_ID=MMETSP0190_2-20130828/190997_1 /ASSEMBLY_ACC=CAM_ASM_000263 /TAXON_ID=37353 /ORGANISM="Rosalina sp." /LENGTH=303 /DNA_ID=CAMNT_0048052537 /DNA_START=1963 /DNA_END=2874 /DNA_ORIENTATION=+
MKKVPSLKDMQDILNGIRPIKRDFLEEPPDAPTWSQLTVSFYDEKAEDADEYFESANEPLAGAVAPQPKLVNNKPMKKKAKNKGAPKQPAANTKFNFGNKLPKQTNAPPANPIQAKMLAKQKKAEEDRKKKEAAQRKRQKEEEEKKQSGGGKSGGGDSTDYVWLCHLDADSGDVFYEKITDGTTQWDRPSEPVKPHWLAHKDGESGELYFENIDTGVTSWDKPDEFSDPDEKWIARKDGDSGDYYFENIETQQTQWESPDCFTEKVPEQEWLRHFDPTSGEYYFENLRTGDTTWDAPTGVNFT